MHALAIIRARSRSIGISRTDVRSLAGKPAIARTVERARQADSVQRRVVVSVDVSGIVALVESAARGQAEDAP